MSLFFRVSGIVLTLMVFLGCGVLIGEHREPVPRGPIAPEGAKWVNSSGDHVVVHNGVWVLDKKP